MAFLLTLSLGAGSALATSGYAPVGEFGNGSLGNVPTDVAVDDATGHVLVVDKDNNRVVVFDSGEPGAAVLTTFGEGELSAPYGIAIDQTNGDVYVSDAGNNRIVRYTSDGAPTPTYTLDVGYASPAHGAGAEQVGSFASPLAIDPSTGNLLVADKGNLRVERFDASGGFVSSFDGSTAPSGAFTSLVDIATGPDGTIYLIADGEVESYLGLVTGSVVESFAADGSLDEVMRGPIGDPAELSEASSIAYDTRLENVLVTSGGNYFEPPRFFLRVLHGGQQVGQVEIPTGAFGTLPVAIVAPGVPLLPLSILTDKIGEGSAGIAGVLAVKGVAVDLTFSPVSAITGFGAHFAGTVNPHGDSGSARFEYRLAGSESWTAALEKEVPAGNAAQPVEEDLTELLPNEVYEARLGVRIGGLAVASSVGQFQTLTIAPGVVTQEATGVSGAGATLNGTVNPHGAASTWFFEYGATAAYGARIPLTTAPAGSGQLPLNFSRTIGGLTAGSTYHFRIVAENAGGITQGTDRTFVAVAAQARAYEEVTPVDQEGSFPDASFGPLALSGTSGISYVTRPAGSGSASAPIYSRKLSLRGESDWNAGINLDPKLGNPRLGNFWRATLGVSNDGAHTFIVTNEKLTPGALEGSEAANLYVKDLGDSSLQLVVATATPGALYDYVRADAFVETFIAGADDFSWVVFYSGTPLLPGVTAGAIYKWSSAGLEVISRLPDGSIPSTKVDAAPISSNLSTARLVSADGSTLLFGLLGGPVYMRHGNVTTAVSVSQIDGETKPALMIATDTSGRYAYFTATVALTVGASEGALYRYDSHSNSIEYISQLGLPLRGSSAVAAVSADGGGVAFVGKGSEGEELTVWHEGELTTLPTLPVEGSLWFQFSPNGRYLTFADPEVKSSGPNETTAGEAYLYDTGSDELACASCRAGQLTHEAFLPPDPFGEKIINSRLPQAVDDQGQVFFTTAAALTSADTNGVDDVYVFQGGLASLISPGNGHYKARLMDISPNGQDVYFATAQPLVARDINRGLDIYDARLGGGFAVQNETPAAACEGEVCQGAWQGIPAVGPLGSEALAGARQTSATSGKPTRLTRVQKLANALKACRAKRAKHKRQTCEKTARKKFGAQPKAKAKSHKGGK